MIDWDRINELQAEVGEDGVIEIVEIFLEEMDEGINELATLTTASTIAEKLHFLKGSAQNIGLVTTSALCLDYERGMQCDASLRPDVLAIRASVDAARTELEKLIN